MRNEVTTKARIQKLAKQWKTGKRGGTLVLVTFFTVALFGFAALSIDVSRVFQEQRHVNVGTDAGALAGVIYLSNQNVNAAISEARAIAGANGVTTNEIAAGARNGFPGQIQVGLWSNSTFQANVQDSSGLYNAIRVPARRTVDLHFAKVVGLDNMRPAVSSVAGLVPAGQVNNAIPFAVSLNQVLGKQFGDTMILNDAGGVTAGNQGKIDLGSYQTPNDWKDAMLSPSGCNCTASVGPIPVITGNSQVKQAWDAIPVGAILTMPIVVYNCSGNSCTADIVGFVRVEVTQNGAGTGSGWSATVKFLELVTGTAGGGTCPNPPCVSARVLVQ